MNRVRIKSLILKLLGLIFCTVPPLSAILLYFPLWKSKGGAAVLSGFTLLLILAALIPFFNTVKGILRSPAAYTMWFLAFVAFFVLSSIAREMTVISFAGFIGNLVGAALFKLSKKGGADDEAKL